MAEMLVVVSKVKDVVKNAGCNMGGDFADALSAHVEEQIKMAVKRAESNGRKTVRAGDL